MQNKAVQNERQPRNTATVRPQDVLNSSAVSVSSSDQIVNLNTAVGICSPELAHFKFSSNTSAKSPTSLQLSHGPRDHSAAATASISNNNVHSSVNSSNSSATGTGNNISLSNHVNDDHNSQHSNNKGKWKAFANSFNLCGSIFNTASP